MTDEYSKIKGEADLTEYANQKLEHVPGGLVCPCCSSGKGANRTPAFSIKGQRWKCFACQAGGDIFDLAGAIHATQDKKEQLAFVKEWVGVQPPTAACMNLANQPHARSQASSPQAATETLEANKERNAQYIKRCQANIDNLAVCDYLASRGISPEVGKRDGLGYDPATKRLIIPWKGSSYYWIGRDITGTSSRKYDKPKSAEVGPQPVWNPDALTHPSYFVVEGPMDALALSRLGFPAVALGGVGISSLIEEALRTQSRSCAILMLDSDEPGTKAQERAHAALEKAGLIYMDYPGDRFAKDADEMWAQDPEKLRAELQRASEEASELAKQVNTERQARLFKTLRPANVAKTAFDLLEMPKETPCIPTGIARLDEMLDGGLRCGLHVLAAASSLGKTTLATQIADAIALAGNDVLYVTLEQSARDLVAKSVARLCYKQTDGMQCFATREMTDLHKRAAWSQQRREAFEQGVQAYGTVVAPHVEILEGVGRTCALDIAGYAACMAEQGRKPVVFVDYLQLLTSDATQDERLSIARNVSDLRQLARDLDTPVVCISAVRRDAYLMPVTLDSMKESGAIEYGADTVLGLQVAGVDMGQTSGSDRKARSEADRLSRAGRAAEQRNVELVVLKQRDGRVHSADQAIRLTFIPQASIFV